MKLKNYLQFWGDKNKNEIQFHKIGKNNENVVVEVDDYQMTWKVLKYLSEGINIEQLENKVGIKRNQLEDIIRFLDDNDLIEKDEVSTRECFFFGNYMNSKRRGELVRNLEDLKVMIIGVGTVGASVMGYLAQLGVKKFLIIDDDVVTKENILHQRYYEEKMVGEKKVLAIKEWFSSNKKGVTVNVYPERVENANRIIQISKEEHVDTIFCCFDNYNYIVMRDLLNYKKQTGVGVFISGYALGAVKSMELSEEVVTDIQKFEEANYDIITSNSGIGVLGDIAASLMVRLWIQKMDSIFDNGKEELFFDYINLETEQSREDFGKLCERKNWEDEWVCKEIFYPYIINELKNYYQSKNNEVEVIEDFSVENDWQLFDDEGADVELYEDYLMNNHIELDGKKMTVMEFAEIGLKKVIPKKDWERYLDITRKIANESIPYISKKKKMYFERYEDEWEKGETLEEKLVCLAWDMVHLKYKRKMDYLDYHPFEDGRRESLKSIIKRIKKVDELNPYINYGGFIDHLINHSFIHISSDIRQSCCIYNSRFNTSDVLVEKKNSVQDIFDIIHEIGHAYYNSYRLGCDWDEYTSETFGLLTEVRLMKVLLNDANGKYNKVIEERLQGIFVGMFSLDLYEKEVLLLDDISLETILDARKKANSKIFGDIELVNDRYSQYNMFLNSEMVVGKREIYLYPMAMLMALYLDLMITKKPEFEKEMVERIKKEQDSFSISDIVDFSNEKNLDDAVRYALSIWKSVVESNVQTIQRCN